MAHVLLINPRACSPAAVRLPLSLLALGAVLEGRHTYRIVDGNLQSRVVETVLGELRRERTHLVGVSVMPGPQVATAIEISAAVRRAHPDLPIVWGGYFPTLYAASALNAAYVDYLVRGQGEDTLLDLLDRLGDAGPPLGAGDSASDHRALAGVPGLSWKERGEQRHGPERGFRAVWEYPELPYHRLGGGTAYVRRSFLGERTGAYQLAVGCRYHCEFCGVVSMFGGTTRLGKVERLRRELEEQRRRFGADAVQFVDHNFFDTEESSEAVLDCLAEQGMPWWCYARADVLARFSPATWERMRRSRLRMAYIGAEAASDEALRKMRKGAQVEHTLEAVRRCREYGVIPELSFILGGPHDPEADVETTFTFVRRLKDLHPECEVILYLYSPTPRRRAAASSTGNGLPVLERYGATGPDLPSTPEEWTEPRWVRYVCHQDAPWLTPRLRRRIRDFSTVLGCRFPTVQDYRAPTWGRGLLRALADWRYRTESYAHPWELRLARRAVNLRLPERDSI